MSNRTEARKKTLPALLTATMLVLVISGCSGNKENNTEASASESGKPSVPASSQVSVSEEPQPSEEDHTPVTLKFAVGIPKDNKAWTAIADAFTKKYPWITIDWEFMDGITSRQALTESIAAGDPVDVLWGEMDLAYDGYIEDLTPYIEKDTEFQDYHFRPGLMESFNVEGKQYAVPRGSDTFVMFYNKDLLNKYGMEPPSNDWTWDDFRKMAKKATNFEEKTIGVENTGLFFSFASAALSEANGNSPHLRAMNEDLSKSLLDQPGVLDDYQWIQDLLVKDEVMLNDKRKKAHNMPDGPYWDNGQAAFYLHVSPLVGVFRGMNLKFNWDIAPMPRGTDKQVGVSFNTMMMMSKASKKKDAAWKFMKFWSTDTEAQKILIDAGGTFPTTDNPELVDYFANSKVYDGLNKDALKRAAEIGEIDARMQMPGGAKLMEVIDGWAMGKGMNEEVSAYDYFPPLVEKLNKDLGDAIDKAKLTQ